MLRNWPISGLRIATPDVELRWPSMDDLDALADRAGEGVHDPAYMPFFSEWSDGDPEVVARRVLQRHWRALGSWRPEDWTLYLAVVHQDTVVGSQSIGAKDFARTQEVQLTSWLGYGFHGKGLGTHARAALLHLAFEGLGAEHAVVVVRQDNEPSQGVCRKFGFVRDGTQINAVRGQAVVSDRYRLDRQSWSAHLSPTVTISGLEPGLALFGLESGDVTAQAGSATLAERPAVTAPALSGVRYYEEADQGAD
ncbi:GNAT family N-acetyltransferase [Streptomyces xiangluensis]|uniref:GNAT family N-acetyltransferase n=1 Tax=Streptomyces xiangluensis TaxID=2665720 RepID=A0ABV8YIW2_9ACTN